MPKNSGNGNKEVQNYEYHCSQRRTQRPSQNRGSGPEAFWNLYFPGAAEHYVVHKMRSHPDFIQELAFVIEVDGTVEGAIFYTHSKVVTPDGEFPTISFGPVLISLNITVRDWVES